MKRFNNQQIEWRDGGRKHVETFGLWRISDRVLNYIKDTPEITPARLYAKCYERVRDGAGYQMFGYDWQTIKVTHPHLAAVMLECVRIHHEVEEAVEGERVDNTGRKKRG